MTDRPSRRRAAAPRARVTVRPRRPLAVVATAVCCLALAAAPVRALEWKALSSAPEGTVAAASLAGFASALAARTGGAVTLAVAGEPDAARVPGAVRSAQAAIGVFPLALLEGEHPLVAVDRVPYLASDYVNAEKLWRVLAPEVERILEARGLSLLYAVPGPPPAPLSRRALTELNAWRGARLVVDAPALAALARDTGMQPVSAPSAREALAGGRADAAFRAADAAVADRAWEYASHYVNARAWFPKTLVVASREALGRLAPVAREAVLAAAREARGAAWAASEAAADVGVQRLRDYGIKATTPSVKLLIRLEAVGRDLLFLWSEGAGEAGALLVERFYEIR